MMNITWKHVLLVLLILFIYARVTIRKDIEGMHAVFDSLSLEDSDHIYEARLRVRNNVKIDSHYFTGIKSVTVFDKSQVPVEVLLRSISGDKYNIYFRIRFFANSKQFPIELTAKVAVNDQILSWHGIIDAEGKLVNNDLVQKSHKLKIQK